MELVVDKLTEFSSSSDEELRDISGLGISHSRRIGLFGLQVTRPNSSQNDHC